jgi:hypothetical protein
VCGAQIERGEDITVVRRAVAALGFSPGSRVERLVSGLETGLRFLKEDEHRLEAHDKEP